MDFSFCPKCGGRLITKKLDHLPRLACDACEFVFYQTSKPTASAIITDHKRILLGKRRGDPRKGCWDIPGGFLEEGEHPEEGLRREMNEELGVEIEIIKFLGIFMDRYGPESDEHTLNIYYLVNILGEPRELDDLIGLQWFSVDSLPEDIAFENIREALEVWKNSLR